MAQEQTLSIIKPDAVGKNHIGDIISRFEKKGLKRLQESLAVLNELPVDKHKYSRLNSCHSFLQEMNEEYLQKTIVFFEEK